ncbi:MAG: substrate-binding domain-containing protein [Treponema sp.]|jgi:ribose transport system substrate-binding protein|nr:substrate-binding domain-containing protein [Treponema sp.]
MKIVARLALIFSGLFALAAFFTSLTRVWGLNISSLDGREPLNYHFSLYLPDNRNSFFTGIIRGAERAAAELNAAVSVHSIDPAKNEFEMASYTGVDGVIVCPYLDDALARGQLEKLGGHNIPVVLLNHNIAHDQPWPFIGTNNFDMGRRIGLISMRLRSAQGIPEPLRLAVVYSDKAPGIYAERELVEMGMVTALGPDASVMSFKTNLNPLDAEALLSGLFRDQPNTEGLDINTIVFTDSSDTVAAAQTLVDMNLVGRVQVIGFGADPGVLENIRKGIVACSVVIDSERIGYEALRSLTALRTTGYTSATIDTGIEIITGSGL